MEPAGKGIRGHQLGGKWGHLLGRGVGTPVGREVGSPAGIDASCNHHQQEMGS